MHTLTDAVELQFDRQRHKERNRFWRAFLIPHLLLTHVLHFAGERPQHVFGTLEHLLARAHAVWTFLGGKTESLLKR